MLRISKRQAREILEFSPLWELHVSADRSFLIMYLECDHGRDHPAVIWEPATTAADTAQTRREPQRGVSL